MTDSQPPIALAMPAMALPAAPEEQPPDETPARTANDQEPADVDMVAQDEQDELPSIRENIDC